MCVFCTAIPASLALGAGYTIKYRREKLEAEERERSLEDNTKILIDKVPMIVAGTLVVASTVYHSQFSA